MMYKYTVRAALLLPLFITVSTDASTDHQNIVPVKLSRNQTWLEAVQDNSCVMVGSDMSGVFNTGSICHRIVKPSKVFTRAWIAAYYTQVWVDFKGCVYGQISSEGITVSADPVKECLLHCNFSGFILTENTCYCSKHVNLYKNNRCKATPCSCKYPYCGSGSYVYNSIVYSCMCEYDITNDKSTTPEEYKDTCMTATYEDNRATLQTSKCNSNHSGLCFDLSNPGNVSMSSMGSWSDSFLNCTEGNRQLAGKDTLLSSTTLDITDGIYWVGAFAESYILWGNQYTFDNIGCIAVHTDAKNQLITDVIACNSSIPALCVDTGTVTRKQSQSYITAPSLNPSAISYTPDRNRKSTSTASTSPCVETTGIEGLTICESESSSTSTGSTDVSTDINSSKTLNGGLKKSPVPAIVGSVIGSVLCVLIIAIIIVLLRRRRVFTKEPTECVGCDGLEIANSQRATNVNYNHINEIKKERSDDLYDHSFIGDKDKPYGTLGTHTHYHDNDSEYDHTSAMDDTYGNAQRVSSRYDVNNTYDHVGAFPDMTGDEAYGHLHENVNNHENEDEYFDCDEGDTHGQFHVEFNNSYDSNAYNAAQVVINMNSTA